MSDWIERCGVCGAFIAKGQGAPPNESGTCPKCGEPGGKWAYLEFSQGKKMTRKEALALYDELYDLCGVEQTPDVKARLKAIAFKFRHSHAKQSLAIVTGRAVRAMGREDVWNRIESLRRAIDEAWPED